MEDPLALTDDPEKDLTMADLEEDEGLDTLDPDDEPPPAKLPTEDRHKADRGCGCQAPAGDMGGGGLLLALVLGVLLRRRRRG
jgi:MYXO-CTERM domain-containing protein